MTGVETRIKVCELCGAEALFHCAADSAFLCLSCDSKVHASNFLVARHVRRILCCSCKSFTGNCISGPVSSGLRGQSLCCKCFSSLFSCSSSSSSSSLDCASSCELSFTDAGEDQRKNPVGRRRQPTEGKIQGESEGVFVNWCKKLGLGGKSRNVVVSLASWALALTPPVQSFRVRLAAAFWFALRVSAIGSVIVNLRRVEEVSGVPSKIIVAVEIRLVRALRLRRRRINTEEGWAENDGA